MFSLHAVDNVHLKDDWLSLFLFIAPLVCFHSAFRKKRNVLLLESDEYYLQKAHQLRLCLDTPRQSRFRVVALIVLNDGTVIPGTNDEPSPAITGALCAERAAFLQLRLVLLEKKKQQQQQLLKVGKVYIVTDASIPVPPGMLCREYMYGHDAVCPNRTLFILQSADSTSQPLILTLANLYPYPPFYLRLSVEEIAIKGQELSILAANIGSNASQIVNNLISDPSIVGNNIFLVENNVFSRLLAAARKGLELDNRDVVHPLRFGAAAAILRKKRDADAIVEIVHAGQRKAAEYGASLDAVCQLAASFQQDDEHDTVLVLMIVNLDQYGILHPPFGIARTFLVEHGHGDCICVFMRERIMDADDNDTTIQSLDDKKKEIVPSSPRLELVAVPTKTLAPFPPEFR